MDDPDASRGCPVDTISPPFRVASPVRVRYP